MSFWKSVKNFISPISGGKEGLALPAAIAASVATGNPGVGVGIYSAMTSANAAKEANETNVALQRENRSWEEEMANTAHQREVIDLKAAGLNPMLSVNSGASVPNVQPASVESLAPVYQNSARDLSSAGIAYKSMLADIAVKKSQVAANSAMATKAHADANVANTSALGVAFDNAAKEADLPAKVRASFNRAYEEEYRKRRPWFWKEFGINTGDVMKTGGKLLSH